MPLGRIYKCVDEDEIREIENVENLMGETVCNSIKMEYG